MADPKSTLPPVYRRSSNGTPLYRKACATCGAVSVVDKRKLALPCHACAMKARRTHGYAADGRLDPAYRVYCGIKARCEQPSFQHYRYYGGRGIKMCAEWRRNPQAFVDWAHAHGWKRGLEIDRLDHDGDYSPENCRISTHRENSQHTRRIKTTPEQARQVRQFLASGYTVKQAAAAACVTYMVAWHIKNNPDVWSNV